MFGFHAKRSLTSWSRRRALDDGEKQSMRHKHARQDRYDSLEASVAMRSKISLTKLLRIAIALLEIPVSGWTCLRTAAREIGISVVSKETKTAWSGERQLTLIDVRRVRLLSDFLSLLLLAIGRRCGFGSLLRCFGSLSGFGGCLGGGRGRGFASSRRGFGCHCKGSLVVKRGERVEPGGGAKESWR